MKMKLLDHRPDLWPANALLLAALVVIGCFAFAHEPGEDLASSFVGCRLLVTGQADHLYSYDPVSFDEIGDDDTWQNTADAAGYTGALHPYVQTPLWAYALQPVCRRVNWTGFLRIFTVLSMLCLAGCLWLVAKHWAQSFFNPLALSIVVVIWVFSQPFQYAAFLMQTHILLIWLTIAGLILAERGKWVAAGALVACAAAVKITPALFVVYWILTKRWKAALAMIGWSAALWLLTVLLVGHNLTDVYLADLHRISRVLIIPMNNQSFAAWLMAPHFAPDEVFDVREFPLPDAVRLVSSVLMLLFTVAGGWIDRRHAANGRRAIPIGAMIALIAATLFAPIAWTHYSVILVMPLMMLMEENRRLRSRWVWAAVIAAVALNYRPLSTDINHFLFGRLSIIHAQFYAWVVTLLALGAVAFMTLRRTPPLHASIAE